MANASGWFDADLINRWYNNVYDPDMLYLPKPLIPWQSFYLNDGDEF